MRKIMLENKKLSIFNPLIEKKIEIEILFFIIRNKKVIAKFIF